VVTGSTFDAVGTAATQSYNNKNAGTGKALTASGLVMNDGNGGANYSISYANNTTSTITPRALTVSASGTNKVYDGQQSAAVTLGDNRVGGDILSLSNSSATFSDKNVGTGKTVSVSGISVTGADAGNYIFNTTASTSADINQLSSVAWTGGTSGNWSLASNWAGGAIPSLNNVAAVTIPGSSSVTYDTPSGATQLSKLTSSGSLTLAGGSLTINGALQSSAFIQTGGTLSSLGTMTVTGTISQTGGTIVSPDLTLSSQGGMALNSQGNQISKLNATNTVSGDIVIKNTGLLSLMGMNNAGGNIDVNNIGGVTTLGKVDASGNISLTANSPLTIGANGGVTAGGSVSLIATNLTSTGNLTLDGPVNGQTVLLDAAGNLDINGTVVGTNGITAKAGGSLTFGLLSVLKGSPTSYTSGGTLVDPRGGSSNSPTNAGTVLTAFLDLFEKALDEQLSGTTTTNSDGSKKRKSSNDTIVTEGETCRP
jgi:hypothetical protein